jgi:hypothetical protein
MARNNVRGGGNRSGSRNNNPSGRNQYSGGVMDIARDRPMAAAAVAAGAAAAGLFLWSKRSQISDQLSSLSDQIAEWADGMRSGESGLETEGIASGTETMTSSAPTTGRRKASSRKSQQQISEEALSLKQTGD